MKKELVKRWEGLSDALLLKEIDSIVELYDNALDLEAFAQGLVDKKIIPAGDKDFYKDRNNALDLLRNALFLHMEKNIQHVSPAIKDKLLEAVRKDRLKEEVNAPEVQKALLGQSFSEMDDAKKNSIIDNPAQNHCFAIFKKNYLLEKVEAYAERDAGTLLAFLNGSPLSAAALEKLDVIPEGMLKFEGMHPKEEAAVIIAASKKAFQHIPHASFLMEGDSYGRIKGHLLANTDFKIEPYQNFFSHLATHKEYLARETAYGCSALQAEITALEEACKNTLCKEIIKYDIANKTTVEDLKYLRRVAMAVDMPALQMQVNARFGAAGGRKIEEALENADWKLCKALAAQRVVQLAIEHAEEPKTIEALAKATSLSQITQILKEDTSLAFASTDAEILKLLSAESVPSLVLSAQIQRAKYSKDLSRLTELVASDDADFKELFIQHFLPQPASPEQVGDMRTLLKNEALLEKVKANINTQFIKLRLQNMPSDMDLSGLENICKQAFPGAKVTEEMRIFAAMERRSRSVSTRRKDIQRFLNQEVSWKQGSIRDGFQELISKADKTEFYVRLAKAYIQSSPQKYADSLFALAKAKTKEECIAGLEKIGLKKTEWLQDSLIDEIREIARARAVELQLEHSLDGLGTAKTRPALLALLKNLTPQQQEEILEKKWVLPLLGKSFSKRDIAKVLPLTDTDIVNSLVAENEQIARTKLLENSALAKVFANLYPAIQVTEAEIGAINQELAALNPGLDLDENTLFSLLQRSLPPIPEEKEALLAKEIEKNWDDIHRQYSNNSEVYLQVRILPNDNVLFAEEIKLYKVLAPFLLSLEKNEKFEDLSKLAKAFDNEKVKTRKDLLRLLKEGQGQPWEEWQKDEALLNSLEEALTDKLFYTVRAQAKKLTLLSYGANGANSLRARDEEKKLIRKDFEKTISVMRKEVEENVKPLFSLQKDLARATAPAFTGLKGFALNYSFPKEVLVAMYRLRKFDSFACLSPEFMGMSRSIAEELEENFDVLVQACDTVLPYYVQQEALIEGQLATLPAPVENPKEDVFSKEERRKIEEYRHFLQDEQKRLQELAAHYQHIDKMLHGDPGAKSAYLQKGALRLLQEAKDPGHSVIFTDFQCTYEDYPLQEEASHFGADSKKEASYEPTSSLSIEVNNEKKPTYYELAKKIQPGTFRQYTIATPEEDGTLTQSGFMEKRNVVSRYDVGAGKKVEKVHCSLIANKMPGDAEDDITASDQRTVLHMISQLIAHLTPPPQQPIRITGRQKYVELACAALDVYAYKNPRMKWFDIQKHVVTDPKIDHGAAKTFMGGFEENSLQAQLQSNVDLMQLLRGARQLQEDAYEARKELEGNASGGLMGCKKEQLRAVADFHKKPRNHMDAMRKEVEENEKDRLGMSPEAATKPSTPQS